ncbi:MAG: signal peptidase I [Treponema sp.]|jgi:signal peptidase I|nr:signal peptidase I [Treponema sp.]
METEPGVSLGPPEPPPRTGTFEGDTGKTGGVDRPARAVLAAFAAALFMKIFLFDFMIAEGRSMTPAIKPGTILLVLKSAYGIRPFWSGKYLVLWTLPREGDVVVFYTPRGEIAVKRCAGLTGEGTFIALGDNSRDSLDSRSYGPVPADHIVGKVLGLSGPRPVKGY